MKTFGEIRNSVQKSSTPQEAAGTFVDGVLGLIEDNLDDPQAMRKIVQEGRENRQGLISALAHK